VGRRLDNEPEQEQKVKYLNDSPDHQRACLELLGSQEGVDEIHEQPQGDDAEDDV
jgi:hypothetical protein